MTLLNFRISEELKSELQKTREKAGLKQEDFMSAMLAGFKETQAEIDTASPIYKELAQVKQLFAQSERLVSNFMELAANEKIQAEEKAQEMIDVARKKIVGLEEKIQDLNALNQNHENKILEQEKIILGLQKEAENLKSLKEDWFERENQLNTRIAQLDAQVKESLDLTNKVQKKETVIADRINEIANLEENSHQLHPTLSIEKSAVANIIDEIQATNPEEYNRLTGSVFSMEEDIIDLEGRKFKRKNVTFEIDVLVEGRLIKSNMKDISASGVLVRTKENIGKYKKAKMVFSIPGIEKPFKLEGRVVRSTGNGIAIEFDEKSPGFQVFLNKKIWQPVHDE